MSGLFQLRPYRDSDEAAAIGLWQRTWQQAYPEIDFAARLAWWRQRWRDELVPAARITVAEDDAGALIGFVIIDADGYLDQLVADRNHWGSGLALQLVDHAKQLSPTGISLLVNADNSRAIRFYEKAGFLHGGDDVNPVSGRKVHRMTWTP